MTRLNKIPSFVNYLLLLPLIIIVAVALVIYYNQGFDRRIPIIVDSDGGVDDVMAIAMLLKSTKFHILAITTVAGNTGTANSSSNILAMLEILNRTEIPVYMGNEIPAASERGYYGYDGFGDFLMPSERQYPAETEHPAKVLSNLVSEQPKKIFLLCLGPLTNIALSLHLNPTLLEDLSGMIFVGSSYKGQGNLRPGVEFNVGFDAGAASFVLDKATKENPVTIIPYETLIEGATFSKVWRKQTFGRTENRLLELLNDAEKYALKFSESWTCFDQVGAAVLINPLVIEKSQKCNLLVEMDSGSKSDGRTYIDDEGFKHILVTKVNRGMIKEILIEKLHFN